MDNNVKDEMKATIKAVRDKMRITKVVCTRSVKGRSGDSFVGFSAAWDTIQEDAGGQGADLIDTLEDEDSQQALSQGMTLKESKIAAYMLAMQADITAFENAAAGSIVRKGECDTAVQAIKHNYSQLMASVLMNGSK